MNLSCSWIWLDRSLFPTVQSTRISAFDRSSAVTPAMAVFRRVFELDSVPPDLTAYFSGDCKFRLFVNGHFVDDGPVEVGGDYGNTQPPDWWFYDSGKVAEFFHPGKNVIVAEVLTVPEAQTDYSVGHPGFTFELESCGVSLLRSDSSWRSFRNPAYRDVMDWHAELFHEDYHALSFDDSSWAPAEALPPELCAKWNLRKLDLPPLAERDESPGKGRVLFEEANRHAVCSDDLTLTALPGPPVCFQLEFDREVAAHIGFEVESEGGASLVLEYQEVPGKTHAMEKYTTAPGIHRFRSTRLNAFRYIQLRVACGSFSSEHYAPVRIRNVTAHTRGFPLGETAPFECSDPELMKIRECVDRTMRLCMMRLHLDSPVHQEGLGCTGDYWIESLIAHALYGETRLAAADLLRTALLLKQKHAAMFHTSYSLLFLEMAGDYFRNTGDADLLDRIFPQIEAVLDRFAGFVGPEGLVSEAPNYMFIDWVNGGGYNYHHPPASRGTGCLTAFYYNALRTGAQLAGILGKTPREQLCRERADQVKRAFSLLWSEEHGCFSDGIPFLTRVPPSQWLPPDDGIRSFTVHTNVLALAYGLAPEEKTDSLWEKIMSGEFPILPQPYFMHFVFEALHRTDRFARYGFELLKRWNVPVAEHPDGLKECWNCGDYSHAWGGTPAYQITRSILGIVPLEPGWRKIRISPCFGTLTSVSGQVPSIRGMVKMRYCDGTLKISLPPGMEYELRTSCRTEVSYESNLVEKERCR